MATANELFDTLLRKLIAQRIEGLKEELCRPIADPTVHNYAVGRIAGFREVFELCDEVQTELNRR
jgi:hypothetical protein